MYAVVNECFEQADHTPPEVLPLHHDGDIVVHLCEGMRAVRRARGRYMRLYVVLHHAGGEIWTHAYRVEHPANGGKTLIHLLKVGSGNQLTALGQWALERWMGGVFGREVPTARRPLLPVTSA